MAEKSKFQDDWERSPGYVYFIAAGNPVSAVKIGISSQKGFKNRMRQIQSANHEPLRILGVIPFEDGERPMMDAMGKEADLHTRFSEFQRFKMGWVGSEWFSFNPLIEKTIQQETLLPADVGLPVSIFQIGPGLPNYFSEKQSAVPQDGYAIAADIIKLSDRSPPEPEREKPRVALVRALGRNVRHLSDEQCRCLAEMLERMGRENGRPPA